MFWDFPDSSVVKALPFPEESMGLIPSQGTTIPGISSQKSKTSNRNNIATNSIKIFKVGHIEKKKNRGDVGDSIKKKRIVSLLCARPGLSALHRSSFVATKVTHCIYESNELILFMEAEMNKLS